MIERVNAPLWLFVVLIFTFNATTIVVALIAIKDDSKNVAEIFNELRKGNDIREREPLRK